MTGSFDADRSRLRRGSFQWLWIGYSAASVKASFCRIKNDPPPFQEFFSEVFGREQMKERDVYSLTVLFILLTRSREYFSIQDIKIGRYKSYRFVLFIIEGKKFPCCKNGIRFSTSNRETIILGYYPEDSRFDCQRVIERLSLCGIILKTAATIFKEQSRDYHSKVLS